MRMKRILDEKMKLFFFLFVGERKVQPVIFVPLLRQTDGISEAGFPADGLQAYLNEFHKIFCISKAQVFGKVEAMLAYRVYPTSSKSILYVRAIYIEPKDKTNRLQNTGSGFEARRIVLRQAFEIVQRLKTWTHTSAVTHVAQTA
jgi:hypothetical protein